MTRPRITTVLRIGTSVLCLVACAALGWLWWRSHSIGDVLFLKLSSAHVVGLGTQRGELGIAPLPASAMPGIKRWWLGWSEVATGGHWAPICTVVPIWTLGFALVLLAVVPWIRWRFSLKTLLITTAIVSALLGLGVSLARG